MILIALPRRLPTLILCLTSVLPAAANTVVRPLHSPYIDPPSGFPGTFDTSQGPWPAAQFDIDLGINFAGVSGAEIRLLGQQRLGSVSLLGSSQVEPFSAEVYATLDDDGAVALADSLLPEQVDFDATIAFRSAKYGKPVDFSPLVDGEVGLGASFFSPPMVAITVVHQSPVVTIDAAALIVTGDTIGSLAGDYDNDGAVYVPDYLLWRDSWGQTVEPGTGADGNRDGIVDAADYSVWRHHYGASLRPTNGYLAGDFNYDGVVNAADYARWRDDYQTHVAPFSHSDADGSGVVDVEDYSIWREQFGMRLPSEDLLSPAAGVPEPSVLLLLLGTAPFVGRSRRR